MPRPARAPGTKTAPTATLGFEAAARRGSAPARSEAIPRSPLRSREANAAKGNRANISIYGQDSRSSAETDEVKWARRQRPFGLAQRARRVRRRGQQPKQSNATTRRLAIMNLAIRGIKADFGPEQAGIIGNSCEYLLRKFTEMIGHPTHQTAALQDLFRSLLHELMTAKTRVNAMIINQKVGGEP